ncbi:hypothetical protein ACFWF7_43650 [Nocardia sp. NPDC060256]|uniref:hypothetical protein n=1 Tax=unclassified Nocardia TaxID=2637762 RepID=UPI0036495C72
MSGHIEDTAPEEHLRYRQYQQDLAAVTDAAEPELVAAVLRDPDQTMAESAVSEHLNTLAAQLIQLDARKFDQWAVVITEQLADHDFLIRRLQEWSLLKSITLDHPWTPEDVVATTDWFQRKAADTVTSRAALTLLAAQGRTQRVRTTATLRLRPAARNPHPDSGSALGIGPYSQCRSRVRVQILLTYGRGGGRGAWVM